MRILVLEDDPEVRDFLGRALREAGYQVTTTASAEQALERTTPSSSISTRLFFPGSA